MTITTLESKIPHNAQTRMTDKAARIRCLYSVRKYTGPEADLFNEFP